MTKKRDTSEFDELADRFANEIRRGENPQVSSYAKEFPEHAEEIHRLFPVLEMMERKATPSELNSEAGVFESEMSQLNSTPPLRKLGDYRIVREIGRGGMGIVFEAYQESLGRKVALKLLPDSAQFDERRQQRFQQEALASAKLHHTNIVPVFGVGTHDHTAYFVMQFIDGQPLDCVLSELSRIRSGNESKTSGSTEAIVKAEASTIATAIIQRENLSAVGLDSEFDLSAPSIRSAAADSVASSSSASSIASEGVYWRNIANIGIQVASALDHAHSRQTLHRDIKPSNLIIDNTGCTWVTDFGLAKYFESPDLTRTGEVVGTLRYMSPEQLNGHADERSDIFSLGLTLYELAGLRPAYDATERQQLVQQVIEANPKPLRAVNRQIPKDLETIIHKCVASDPQSRYQNSSAVVSDLERFIAGEPVQARRINPVQRVAKWCRRRPAVASLIAALAVSLIAGIAGVTWQWHKTSDALVLAKSNLSEANRQTEMAQEHFAQARESVNRFFTVVSQQRLLREPGFQPLRKELLQEALDYHNQFVAQYRDDDELRFELAQSLYQIAEIEGTLSANPVIADSLDEPIQIFEELVDSNPDKPVCQLWLARCLGLKSNIVRRFDMAASMDFLNQAIEVLEELRTNHPELGADELAKNYSMLGLSYEQIDRSSGRTVRSLDNYSKAYLLRKEIQTTTPEDVSNIILLAEILRDLGITYRRQGDNDKAVEHYDLAMATLQPVVEEYPEKMTARNSLGSISNSIGFFYGRGNTAVDFEKSLSYYEISKEQYQVLADNNPLVIQYQDGLARAALNAGGVYQVQGDLEKALEYRSYAARLREKLCNLNPNAPHVRSSWAVSLNGVGATLRDMDRIEEAIRQHELAHEQHLIVTAGDRVPSVARMRMINGVKQLARAQAAGEMFEDAVASIDSIDEVALPQDLRAFFSQGVEYAILASKIGRLDTDDGGEFDEALLNDSLTKSKAAFARAATGGFDVLKWIADDTAFQNFTQYPECAEIQAWLHQEFGAE